MSRFLIILFIALCCHSRNGIFATPVLAPTDQQNTTTPEIAGLQTLTEQHYLQSMINELLNKVLIDPFKQMVTVMALYLEIFSVASGAHILSLTNTSTQVDDRQQQLIAIASTNLWLNLTMMEYLNDIFLNASYAVTPILDNTSTQALPTIIREMFEKIENTITRNDSLALLYRREKSEAEKLTLPALASGTGNPDKTYEFYPRFRAFIVRRQLLEHLTGYNFNDTVKFQRHVLSQAVIQLAKETSGKRIQEIFDEAVQITVDKVDPTIKIGDPSRAIDEVLFSVLEEKFKTDLNGEFVKIKADLTKKYGM